jgi:hypothetical protein
MACRLIADRPTRFVGVAPDAKMLSFKVFGASGYSDEETVIEGFMMAFDSGVSSSHCTLFRGSSFPGWEFD